MSKLILVAATFYCTNVLTKTEFGEFSFIRNTLTMILTICANNFSSLCTKYATEAKTSDISVQRLFILFVFSFALTFVAGILLECLPETYLNKFFGGIGNVDYFRFAGLLLPVFMLQPLLEGVLRGLMKFKLIGYIQVATSVLYVVSLVIGIHYGRAAGAVYGLYAYLGVYSLAVLVFLLKDYKPKRFINRIKGAWKQYPTLYKMILPVFVLSFIEAPIFWYLQVLLTKESSVEAVASMTVMKQLRNFAVLIPTYFFNTFLAFAGKMNADKMYKEYFNKFDRLFVVFGFIGIVLALIISSLSKPLLGLYNATYTDDWVSLCISNLCIPLSLLISLLKTELLLQEHQRFLMVASLIWNIIWIGVFCVLIQAGTDALIAFFISEVIGLAFNCVLSFACYIYDKRKLLRIQS